MDKAEREPEQQRQQIQFIKIKNHWLKLKENKNVVCQMKRGEIQLISDYLKLNAVTTALLKMTEPVFFLITDTFFVQIFHFVFLYFSNFLCSHWFLLFQPIKVNMNRQQTNKLP